MLEKYKYVNILNSNNFNNSNHLYEKLFNELEILQNSLENNKHNKNLLESLQKIVNEISSLVMNNGSLNISDLISITIGNSYLQYLINNINYKEKFLIINKFLNPISYQILNWKDIKNNYDISYNDKKNNEKINKNKILMIK